MPTCGYLSQSLRRPLPTKDAGILRTVADAAGYMMALSKDRQRAHWQRAARLLGTGRRFPGTGRAPLPPTLLKC
jgi:hypothetical protein